MLEFTTINCLLLLLLSKVKPSKALKTAIISCVRGRAHAQGKRRDPYELRDPQEQRRQGTDRHRRRQQRTDRPLHAVPQRGGEPRQDWPQMRSPRRFQSGTLSSGCPRLGPSGVDFKAHVATTD